MILTGLAVFEAMAHLCAEPTAPAGKAWAVFWQGRRYGGFTTQQHPKWFAAQRPGAEVRLVDDEPAEIERGS